MKHNKLVRDKIPAIIARQGKIANTRILSDEEYTLELERKLDEEVQEFHVEKNLEELADIMEVVCALAENLGASKEELTKICRAKHEHRGGFHERIYLISVDDVL